MQLSNAEKSEYVSELQIPARRASSTMALPCRGLLRQQKLKVRPTTNAPFSLPNSRTECRTRPLIGDNLQKEKKMSGRSLKILWPHSQWAGHIMTGQCGVTAQSSASKKMLLTSSIPARSEICSSLATPWLNRGYPGKNAVRTGR